LHREPLIKPVTVTMEALWLRDLFLPVVYGIYNIFFYDIDGLSLLPVYSICPYLFNVSVFTLPDEGPSPV
jgi:hypothetical protein